MKKFISILIMSLITIVSIAQKTQTYDLIIHKSAPMLHLYGTGANINFNNSDLILTQSSNLLTLTGGNLTGPNLIQGYTTTVTAGATTTLTAASTHLQFFTGSTTQTCQLPVVVTMKLGMQFYIINNSTGIVTVTSSGGNTLTAMVSGTRVRATCISLAGTDAASWSYYYQASNVSSGKKLTVSNTLTLAGTDATTITFPTTSATLARTDAGNTFTGNQIINTATSGTGLAINGGRKNPNSLLVLSQSSVTKMAIDSSGNYSSPGGITLSGTEAITLSGTATVWDDLMFPSHSLKSVGTTAKPDYDVVGQTLDFPEDTTEAIGFAVQMPHDWLQGSTIYPHVHWLRESADSVDWTFRYKWFNIGATLPVAWTTKKLSHNTSTWTSGTIHEISRVVNAVGISGSGKTISSILIVKFYRKDDSYTGDAKLLQIDIHYERDGLGSRTESAK